LNESDVHIYCCSTKDVALALLYPWEMGDSAAAVQQALVRGLSEAIATVLHTLPAKQTGSAMPSTAQVLQVQRPSYMVAQQYKRAAPVPVWVTAAWL
jgi:hypothetical protein